MDKVGNSFKKKYPEFGYEVEYYIKDDLLHSKNDAPTKEIDWLVRNEDGDYLMHGVFKSHDYYRSSFDLPLSSMDENVYESLFYLYFENIKLECIGIVEYAGEEISEDM